MINPICKSVKFCWCIVPTMYINLFVDVLTFNVVTIIVPILVVVVINCVKLRKVYAFDYAVKCNSVCVF